MLFWKLEENLKFQFYFCFSRTLLLKRLIEGYLGIILFNGLLFALHSPDMLLTLFLKLGY